ncbi:hypothetical protein GRS48_03490 [Halorubrum sp. JWXQ-INN 858]|uniref:hypothetical protein n=1 Tax=Halorubrum sp. JWXQ-INN 858 TaxID=2690782 RepID=UPI00135717A4|nr:hypothetical protein [Halorubrum sp. JWXQ-INN 858]MWV63889.1 hypothetical protein [Halorubrum sp. JWXQ-INN 858]
MPAEPRLPGTNTPYWVAIAFIPVAAILTLVALFGVAMVLGLESGDGGGETLFPALILGLGAIFALFLYVDIRYVRRASHWYPSTGRWLLAAALSPFVMFVGTVPVAVWYLRKRRAALGVPEDAWVTIVRERVREFET